MLWPVSIHYVVRAEFDDEALRQAFVAWLVEGGHARDVCAAGATSAEIVRVDGAPPRVEVRYVFESRDSFARYEREHAPRLRDEGKARFPGGVRMERFTGRPVHLELASQAREKSA